jgi:hypothetical protein
LPECSRGQDKKYTRGARSPLEDLDMPDRPDAPDQDPLLAEILAVAAHRRAERVALDLDDPALRVLVDRAVASCEGLLTPEGVEEARRLATFALGTHPDIGPVLERVRKQQASGVRLSRSPAELDDAARKVGGRRGS